MELIRRVFLQTIAATRPVIASLEVARRWDEPSALREFSVRGLAGHLVRAPLTVDSYLERPEPGDEAPISAAAYYANLDPDISSPLNVAIRQQGEELADGGPERLITEFDQVVCRLEERLRHEPDDRLVTVAGDDTMRLNDYLATRIVELAVHVDDLAVSVGLAPPALPAGALEITIDTLVDIARYRHGNLAVLRALSRHERDTANALRVF